MNTLLNNIDNINYIWYLIFIVSKLNIFNEGEEIFNQYNFYYKCIVTILLLYYFNYFSKIEVNITGEDITGHIKTVVFTGGLIMISEIIYQSLFINIKDTITTQKKIKTKVLNRWNNYFK
jgi:hypothetical protein